MSKRIGPGPTGRWAEPGAFGRWHVCRPGEVQPWLSDMPEADARLLVYGSPWGGLGDEEAGRAWCEKAGKWPVDWDHADWLWAEEGGGLLPAHTLPAGFPDVVYGCHPTEAAAYAEVGAGLRRLAALGFSPGGLT